MKDDLYINTATQICECGSAHDAFTAALRLARQSMRLDEFGEVCPMWFMAVGQAFANIAVLFADAKAQHKAANSPGIDMTLEQVRELRNIVEQSRYAISAKVAAAGFQNPTLTRDVAKYVCEEIKAGDTSFEDIARGPSVEQMQDWGFVKVPISAKTVADLAELLGIDPSAIQKTH